VGEDIEMTCGYRHQDGLNFQKIEWHRLSDYHSGIMFFRYINHRGSVYNHDWIDESLISYHVQEIDIGRQQFNQENAQTNEDKITVLKLKLHNAAGKMSGKYECQIFMSMIKKKETLLVPASRHSVVNVIDKNDPDAFNPSIRIENNTVGEETVLDCLGEGSPAPYLVWSSVNADGNLEQVAKERLELFPINFEDSDDGIETSKIRLTGPFTGQYACKGDSRKGKNEIHFIEAEEENDELNWSYKGTTTTEAPVVVVEEEDHTVLIFIFVGSSLAVFLFFIILCCCCCCCTRRRKKEKRRRRALENLEADKIRSQMLLYRGRSRSTARSRLYSRHDGQRSISRRSTKRRAPDPVTSGSTSTLSMSP